MAIKSGLFNSVNGDRRYKAEFFAEYFASFIKNGVFPDPSTGLQVIANGDMTVSIRAGKAWINGYYFANDSDYTVQLDIADGVLKRVDRIGLRLDYSNREIVPVIIKGIFASSPVAPALQRDADAYEIALADVLINNGAISIAQANITDHRLNSNLCGIVRGTVEEIDTTNLFAQYDDAFQTWFATIQDILDDNVAANLANRISDLETGKADKTELTAHVNNYVKNPAYALTTGINAYSVTLDPAPSLYSEGMGIVIKVGTAATDNASLNINGLGAKPIVRTDGTPVNDLKANAVYTLRYGGSSFILQGEGGEVINEIVPIGLFASNTGIPGSFGLTNKYLVTTKNSNIEIYSKQTKKLVKSIAGSPSLIVCNGTRVVCLGNNYGTNINVYTEELNIVSTFNIDGSASALLLDGDYLYIYSGSHGGSNWKMSKYNINTGSLISQGPAEYGVHTFVESSMDENYLYTKAPSGYNTVRKTSKTSFSNQVNSPLLGSLVRIFVLGSFVYATTSGGTTFKLNKSDLSIVSQHNIPIYAASAGELYIRGTVNFETGNVSVVAAADENLVQKRESTIINYTEAIVMDKSDVVRKPTLFIRRTSGSSSFIEKVIDYGGTVR